MPFLSGAEEMRKSKRPKGKTWQTAMKKITVQFQKLWKYLEISENYSKHCSSCNIGVTSKVPASLRCKDTESSPLSWDKFSQTSARWRCCESAEIPLAHSHSSLVTSMCHEDEGQDHENPTNYSNIITSNPCT